MIAGFYAVLWMGMTKTANRCGYCLAIHGSMGRDRDVVAVHWTEDAASPLELVRSFKKRNKLQFSESQVFEDKPHGRKAISMRIPHDWGENGNFYVDLSIMPRKEKKR